MIDPATSTIRPGHPARAGLAALALAAVGCASRQPAPPPPPPPAPTQLTIFPERGQSKAQQGRDRAECESWATQQATSSAGWAQAFTDCMAPRGYSIR